jgi:hypothetical protein
MAKSAEAFDPIEQLWIPYSVHGSQGGRRRRIKVEGSDLYAAVDDIADQVVIFEVSEWPRLDREGRLYFGRDPFELVVAVGTVQIAIDQARRQARITAPNRPVRVGDAFMIRGLPSPGSAFEEATMVLDISAAAREVAKAALYGAVASTLRQDYADRMGLKKSYREAEPEAGYFDVRPGKGGPRAETAT